jgi:hypothetical protein
MKIELLNMVIDKRKHLRTTPIIVGGIFGDNLPSIQSFHDIFHITNYNVSKMLLINTKGG